ncbi:homoserine kinase [Bradyrhizobium genosp. P]|uniref:homoserine kinase n=1 Tax=Bradyrhizobium genosp. P TaxID=83641 RepID=UPI003CECC13C
MATYTHVPDDELRAFVAHYDLGVVASCKGIAEGVENSNYLLRTDRGAYLLTLYEKRVAPADLPFFFGLMEHLTRSGITCPVPVRARDGQALHQLCGRLAAIVTFVDGISPHRIEPHHCAEIGRTLAKLHLASINFAMTRPNRLSVIGWRSLYSVCREHADQVCFGIADELAEELELLEAEWPRNLPEGIIHADLFPDNVLFRGSQVSGVVDFYFACNDFLAYDIAICINAWCFEHDGAFNVTKAMLLLSNYRSVRPMGADEIDALPLLARGSALRFLLTRLHDSLNPTPGALVRPRDPLEYVQKLRFHRRTDSPTTYGLG